MLRTQCRRTTIHWDESHWIGHETHTESITFCSHRDDVLRALNSLRCGLCVVLGRWQSFWEGIDEPPNSERITGILMTFNIEMRAFDSTIIRFRSHRIALNLDLEWDWVWIGLWRYGCVCACAPARNAYLDDVTLLLFTVNTDILDIPRDFFFHCFTSSQSSVKASKMIRSWRINEIRYAR